MTRLLILKTGRTAEEVLREHGDYDRWFGAAVERRFGGAVGLGVRDVTRVGASLGSLEPFAGVIVTGSTSAAHRPEPWMGPLSDFLRTAERAGRPVLCVCFGMQLLAQARGGRVATNPLGWEIGGAEIALTADGRADPLFAGLPPSVKVLTTHQDRVERLPPGAVLLASNACSSVQAFRAAGDVWGVQFHPEATRPILERLIRLRADQLGGGEDRPQEVRRLLDGLTTPDLELGRTVLDNFVRLCLERAGATSVER